jgi:RimJ/RimL family protein N-acetyltransferase
MLTGDLVRLRAYELDDLDRCWAWVNDEEVMRFVAVSALPISRASEEEWIRRVVMQTRPPEITYAIEVLDGGHHIGSVSLHKIGGPAHHAELGIMIGDKAYWNRGFGTDTVTTMVQFAFDELNLNRVSLTVDEDNGRGIACYRKCGFVEEGRLRQDRFRGGRYFDTIVMGVLREEYWAGLPSSAGEANASG